MSNETTTTATRPNLVRILVIGVLIVAAFLGAYKFAAALSAPKASAAATAGSAAVPAGTVAVNGGPGQSAAGGSGTPGCACCGSTQPTANGVTGSETKGAAALEGNVQKVSVDVSNGTYNPNVITLKAGVPAEITFGQSTGCTGQVQSKDLGFFEDLTQGPKTVKLPALEKGEYSFSCGMSMVYGKIVVE